jgi:hypothetical protein
LDLGRLGVEEGGEGLGFKGKVVVVFFMAE